MFPVTGQGAGECQNVGGTAGAVDRKPDEVGSREDRGWKLLVGAFAVVVGMLMDINQTS